MTVSDRFRLDGRVALVTGASRGLGAAMARALAEAGADVALHASRDDAEGRGARDRERLRRPHRVRRPPTCRSRDAADRLVAEAAGALGPIDILVNNAGIIRRAPAADYTDADWDDVLEVEPVERRSACAAPPAATCWRAGSGKIINIASLLSFQGGIRVPAYAAAKGGVAQLTKALANEWAAQRRQRQRDRAGIHAHRQHAARCSDDPVRYDEITGADSGGTMGGAGRSRRARRVSRVERVRLRARPRARRRRRMDGAMNTKDEQR